MIFSVAKPGLFRLHFRGKRLPRTLHAKLANDSQDLPKNNEKFQILSKPDSFLLISSEYFAIFPETSNNFLEVLGQPWPKISIIKKYEFIWTRVGETSEFITRSDEDSVETCNFVQTFQKSSEIF